MTDLNFSSLPILSDTPKLVVPAGDRIMWRSISELSDNLHFAHWVVSDPLPVVSIVHIYEIFRGILIVVGTEEDGSYVILRSFNYTSFSLVHRHASAIHGLFFVDMGHALFCADDGWWATTNSGEDWGQATVGGPIATSAVIIGDASWNKWIINCYGSDKKLYYFEYPDCSWEETFDTSTISSGRWHPALDGAQVGLMAGAGNKLLVSHDIGKTWQVKRTFDGIIRQIIVSANSGTPVFYITITYPGTTQNKLYYTNDLGDNVLPSQVRSDAALSVESVFPTGSSDRESIFAVISSRTTTNEHIVMKYDLIRKQSDF